MEAGVTKACFSYIVDNLLKIQLRYWVANKKDEQFNYMNINSVTLQQQSEQIRFLSICKSAISFNKLFVQFRV